MKHLSLTARLAVALRLFAAYCEQRGLRDPEIDRFLDHLWSFIALPGGGVGFDEWVAGEPSLVHCGLGEPLPPWLTAELSKRGVLEREFARILRSTTEVLYGSMYAAADERGSRSCLLEVAEVAVPAGAAWPDMRQFADSRWLDGHGWGARQSAATLSRWRGRNQA